MDRLRRALLVLGAAALAGCHNYIPVERPTPGTTVKVTVPVSSAVQDRSSSNPSQASIEGVVVEAADSVVLAVMRRTSYGAFRDVVRLDTISLAMADAVALEERVFSQNRSVALGLALAAVATGLGAAAFSGQSGGGPGPPGNGGDTSRPVQIVPILKIVFGR